MAINPLYGYDTTLYGYGQANRPGSTPFLDRRNRQFPAWMTDPAARGIGVEQTSAYAPPPAIDIPRGNGQGGFNQGGGQAQQPATQPVQLGYGPTGDAGEGAGAAGEFSGGPADIPASGYLADILGALGLSTGQYGGLAGSNIDNQGKTGDFAASNQLGGDFGAMGDLGSKGDIDNGAKGDIGGDISGGGDMGGGDMGSGGDMGGGDMGASGGSDPGSGGMYRGGVVTRNKLQGPNPPGPDDGFAPLDVGEGVLTAEAMKHYGPAFLRRLNRLQVPKGASKR